MTCGHCNVPTAFTTALTSDPGFYLLRCICTEKE